MFKLKYYSNNNNVTKNYVGYSSFKYNYSAPDIEPYAF